MNYKFSDKSVDSSDSDYIPVDIESTEYEESVEESVESEVSEESTEESTEEGEVYEDEEETESEEEGEEEEEESSEEEVEEDEVEEDKKEKKEEKKKSYKDDEEIQVVEEDEEEEEEEYIVECYECGKEIEYDEEDEVVECDECGIELDLNDLTYELVDADTAFQMLLLQEENPELYEKFMEVRKYLVDEVPKIDVLLKTPMHMKDKARIIELFEMFCVCEPLTFEWLELKKQIKDMMERAVAKYDNDQKIDVALKNKIKEELEQLKKFNTTTTDDKIALLDIPVEYKHLLYRRYQMLQEMNQQSDEYGKVSDWVSTVLKIPFGKYLTIPGENIIRTLKERLDKEIYGLDLVKEQILIYISNKLNNPEMKNYPLGLIGPPGTCKTQSALMISKALDIPFQQLSGGGLIHLDGIHGHSYTYVGSQPGHITKSLIRMGCMNGILFIDEFDKIPLDKSLNSVLQIIDPVQNHNFQDNYIGDIPIDLSGVWYILSMNKMPENGALRDRIFPIHIPAYTHQQKFQILKNHTIPKMLEQSKLKIVFEDDVINHIVRTAKGDGMRQCIHTVKDIVYKLVFLKNHPDMTVSFKVELPEHNYITMDIIQKLMSTKKEPTYNSMYT